MVEDTRQCSECAEHSGIIERFNSGTLTMLALKADVTELKGDFKAHTKLQSARTFTMLILLISTLLTSLGSVYVGTVKNAQANQPALEIKHYTIEQLTGLALALKETIDEDCDRLPEILRTRPEKNGF